MVRMATGEPGGGERVLFIEDSPTLAQLLEIRLVQAGHEVLRAGSGEEGLELARAKAPDLLLCDVMLPGIDGFEVVRVLRRDLTTANMSIIMLAAMANVMEGLDAGADDYVLKPCDHRELLARVRSVLRRQGHAGPLPPHRPARQHPDPGELERAIAEEPEFAPALCRPGQLQGLQRPLRVRPRRRHPAAGRPHAPRGRPGHRPARRLRRPRRRDDFVAITAEEAAKAVTVPPGVAVGRHRLDGHPAPRPLRRGGRRGQRDEVGGKAAARLLLGRGRRVG